MHGYRFLISIINETSKFLEYMSIVFAIVRTHARQQEPYEGCIKPMKSSCTQQQRGVIYTKLHHFYFDRLFLPDCRLRILTGKKRSARSGEDGWQRRVLCKTVALASTTTHTLSLYLHSNASSVARMQRGGKKEKETTDSIRRSTRRWPSASQSPRCTSAWHPRPRRPSSPSRRPTWPCP